MLIKASRGSFPLPEWDRQGPGTAACLLLTWLRGRLILLPKEAEEAPPHRNVFHGLFVRVPLLRLALLGPLLISCLPAQIRRDSALKQSSTRAGQGSFFPGTRGLPVSLPLHCLAPSLALSSSPACQTQMMHTEVCATSILRMSVSQHQPDSA